MTSPRLNDQQEFDAFFPLYAELAKLINRLMLSYDGEEDIGGDFPITIRYADGDVTWRWRYHARGDFRTLWRNTDNPRTDKHLLTIYPKGAMFRGKDYDHLDCLQLLEGLRKHLILDSLADV